MSDDRGVHVGRLVLGAILLLIGAAWLVVTLDLVDLPIQSAMAAGLILIGIVILVVGRHGGLVTLGVILTVMLAFMSLLDVPFEGGVGERTFRPASTADLRQEYRMAIGRLTVDLTSIEGTTISDVEISLGIGQVVVILPDEVSVRVEGDAGAGQVKILGSEQNGLGVEHSITENDAVFEVRVAVGLGQVEVRR
ncbi:MAG TPA: LiaF domain-containing protein [Actinomycetota bacterium]|nr:LiaF domain-containing protein [Actinomycetota bacterium]